MKRLLGCFSLLMIGLCPVYAQSIVEQCNSLEKQLSETRSRQHIAIDELYVKPAQEESVRKTLEAIDRALTDQNERTRFISENIKTPAARRELIESYELPWKNEYNDDLVLLRLIRERVQRRADKLRYLIEHREESQQRLKEIDKQLAKINEEQIRVGCNKPLAGDDLTGTWVAKIVNDVQKCTILYTFVLKPEGSNRWKGTFTSGGNCSGPSDKGEAYQVVLKFDGPGKVSWELDGGLSNEATFNKNQIEIDFIGQRLVFRREN